jgi:SAM-dependent methyltransferase
LDFWRSIGFLALDKSMNRKQRRAARSAGNKPAPAFATPADPAAQLARLFNAAVTHHHVGQVLEAERCYRQIIAAFPGHAEAHSRLGALLIRQNKMTEALAHIEQAVALQPDLFEAHGNLAQAALWSGQGERAIEAACRAVELKDTPQSRALFAQCIALARFSTDDGRFRRLVLRALVGGWVRPRELNAVSVSLMKLSSVVKGAIVRAEGVWPARLPADEMFDAGTIAALARDELLCRLLECDPIADVGLERLLTNVRGAMLEEAAAGRTRDEHLLGFYCSLAKQCFINDYVYTITESEAACVSKLRCLVEQTLAAASTPPALTVAALAAYLPLHGIANAEAFLAQAWPQPVAAVIDQQVKEPMEERHVASAISPVTVIDDPVSRAVREQYEENPYPRWTRAGPPALPAVFGLQSQQLGEALIAGCGTGLSTIEFAGYAPEARILAIDLSLASLSYAKRMAQKFGLRNIKFAQADIMNLASLQRQFDFIDASGVLHHLADPWEGWRILLSLLRPGGRMQIGLYSELARRNVVAARALIAERGYRPNPDNIRRCREEIMATGDPLLKSLSGSSDFFTIAECRDLLFHVQEHRTTLPEIQSFLAANGAEFGGFFLDALTHHRFTTRFPHPGASLDLDCWHIFETEIPATFAAMYQFSVTKPAAHPRGRE